MIKECRYYLWDEEEEEEEDTVGVRLLPGLLRLLPDKICLAAFCFFSALLGRGAWLGHS